MSQIYDLLLVEHKNAQSFFCYIPTDVLTYYFLDRYFRPPERRLNLRGDALSIPIKNIPDFTNQLFVGITHDGVIITIAPRSSTLLLHSQLNPKVCVELGDFLNSGCWPYILWYKNMSNVKIRVDRVTAEITLTVDEFGEQANYVYHRVIITANPKIDNVRMYRIDMPHGDYIANKLDRHNLFNIVIHPKSDEYIHLRKHDNDSDDDHIPVRSASKMSYVYYKLPRSIGEDHIYKRFSFCFSDLNISYRGLIPFDINDYNVYPLSSQNETDPFHWIKVECKYINHSNQKIYMFPDGQDFSKIIIDDYGNIACATLKNILILYIFIC